MSWWADAAVDELGEKLDRLESEHERLKALASATWPLVEQVRQIVAEHYPDGSKHDDPEYERRRAAMAALVRHAAELRDAGGDRSPQDRDR